MFLYTEAERLNSFCATEFVDPFELVTCNGIWDLEYIFTLFFFFLILEQATCYLF